jgi:hypothetical protein
MSPLPFIPYLADLVKTIFGHICISPVDISGPVDNSETFNECANLDKQNFYISARDTPSLLTDNVR